MLKIINEFWESIKNHEKTIELRKVKKLEQLLLTEDDNLNCSRSRINVEIYESENRNFLGHIVINGYEVIDKRALLKWIELITDFLTENEYVLGKEVILDHIPTEIDILLPPWFIKNVEWLIKYETFIKDYFKDENEILILHIEKWN